MPGGDATESGGDTTDSGDDTARCRVRTTESGGRQFWAVLDNFTCKSRTNPAEWSDDEHGPWMEALTKWRWDPLDGDKTFWAYLALIRLGHSPTKPFFKHVFSKLKKIRCLRGIKKQELFDKLSLPHLERLRPHLNSDEVLSMAIHVSISYYPQVACTKLRSVRGTRVGVRPPKSGRRQHSRSGPGWPGGGRRQSHRQHCIHPRHEPGPYRLHTAAGSRRDRGGGGSS